MREMLWYCFLGVVAQVVVQFVYEEHCEYINKVNRCELVAVPVADGGE